MPNRISKKTSRKTYRTSFNNLMLLGVAVAVVAGIALFVQSKDSFDSRTQAKGFRGNNSKFNRADFSTKITNRYFSLSKDMKMVFEAQLPEGVERNEIDVTGQTKTIMGVKTLIYFDKVWADLNGDGKFADSEIIENTKDYLAQDRQGNVWYFGEEVINYSYDANGKLLGTNNTGSWTAGVDGAEPGIWMEANPKVGDVYKQEYYPGKAEDMGEVISTTETVTVPYGTFTNCLKTLDTTNLNPASREHKYYCPEIRAQALEEDIGEEAAGSKLISLTRRGGNQNSGNNNWNDNGNDNQND